MFRIAVISKHRVSYCKCSKMRVKIADRYIGCKPEKEYAVLIGAGTIKKKSQIGDGFNIMPGSRTFPGEGTGGVILLNQILGNSISIGSQLVKVKFKTYLLIFKRIWQHIAYINPLANTKSSSGVP